MSASMDTASAGTPDQGASNFGRVAAQHAHLRQAQQHMQKVLTGALAEHDSSETNRVRYIMASYAISEHHCLWLWQLVDALAPHCPPINEFKVSVCT